MWFAFCNDGGPGGRCEGQTNGLKIPLVQLSKTLGFFVHLVLCFHAVKMDDLEECEESVTSSEPRSLTTEECEKLEKQNSRIISEFQANKLEKEAKKNWDLFYKRNETRFFKDRHWTTREFQELLNETGEGRRVMLEVGCGVGNLVFPLLELGLDIFVYACDFSTQAITLLKQNPKYSEDAIKAFQADITSDVLLQEIPPESIDLITMVFVLSAINPDKYHKTLKNLFTALKPGGVLLFRDYGLYDMAQLRFKAGTKIAKNFYARQDGTRSYYFSLEELTMLFENVGYEISDIAYAHRRTINKREGINVPRIFVQAKLKKKNLCVTE